MAPAPLAAALTLLLAVVTDAQPWRVVATLLLAWALVLIARAD